VQVPRGERVVLDQDLLESAAGRASVRPGAAEALRDGAGNQGAQKPTVARTASRRRPEKSPIGRGGRAGLLHHLARLLSAGQLARICRHTWTVRFQSSVQFSSICS